MKAQLTVVRPSPVKWSGGARKSKPWTVEELLVVDGLRCTYTIAAEGILVHLPGKRTLPLVVVRAEYLVLDPKCWRAEDYE
jgi:hypothetical protein